MASNQELKCGDLIEISRGMYQHWAVYIGDGEVVHKVRPGTGKAIVKREELTDAVGDHHGYSVHNYLDNKYISRDPSQIKAEALSHVGEECPYNLLTQNCEHFATDMRYGEAESRQVLQGGIIFATIVMIMITVGIPALVIPKKQREATQKAKKRCIRPPQIVVDVPSPCPCEEDEERVQLQHTEISAQSYAFA